VPYSTVVVAGTFTAQLMVAPLVVIPDAEVVEKTGGFATVTMMGEEVAILLFSSVVDAVSVCNPLVEDAVSQEIVYGDEVTAEPKGLASR
jgi:hypothetical protein